MNAEKYKKHFNQKKIVKSYLNNSHLYLPEILLIGRMFHLNKPVKMLDIGIGAGRTTLYFTQCANEYYGVDYSEPMIAACKERFHNHTSSFLPADARNLIDFKDNFFDVVLFSFNGIDSLEHEDRLKALNEIKRVCKKGGVIFFSSHNLITSHWIFKFHFHKSPARLLGELKRWLKVQKNNRLSFVDISKMDHAMICDGFAGSANNYYIHPSEQIKQLKELGLKNIKIYSKETGEVLDEQNVLTSKDGWLYYECNT